MTGDPSRAGEGREIARQSDKAKNPVFSGGTLFIDLDTVLLAQHQGRRGIELGLQADLPAGIERLQQVGGRVVVLVEPPPTDRPGVLATANRLATLHDGLGPQFDSLLIVTCPHVDGEECDCTKPATGLIEYAIREHKLEQRGGWYICADQEGVQMGRLSGLKVIRIGPAGEDHLSAVHRADYEARDLLDAANHIMLEALPSN
jgi:histidinol phosphatase-like enzyme